MRFFILFLSCLILSFSAAGKEQMKKVQVDINQDGKIDRIENYKNGVLISIERDLKFSGRFDETTYYFPYTAADQPIEIVKKDTNGDGKIDRIETVYENRKHDLLIVKTQASSKFDEKFDKIWTTNSKLNQQKDSVTCNDEGSFDSLPIMSLAKNVDALRYKLDDGFYKTGWGYDIHQSCLDQWGANDFPNLLKNSITKGLQCLSRLAEDNKKNNPNGPNGAYRNLKELEYLLKSKPVAITCNEKDYNWNAAVAHASTTPGAVLKDTNITHPFLSLSPLLKNTPEEKTELMATIFHEQLHNLGFRHGESIEYPYACEVCCIKKDEGKENTVDACRLCSGNYESNKDKKYLIDMIAWSKTSYQEKRAENALLSFQKEFPDDRFGVLAYASAASNIWGPVGLELGKILKKNLKDLTPEETKLLESSQEYSDEKNLKAVQKYSQVAAQTHYLLYVEKNSGKALGYLKQEIPKIKKLLALSEKATKPDEKAIYRAIKEKITEELKDIWLDDYPHAGSADSDLAYDILVQLKLSK